VLAAQPGEVLLNRWALCVRELAARRGGLVHEARHVLDVVEAESVVDILRAELVRVPAGGE
jgi:hypothetical protein